MSFRSATYASTISAFTLAIVACGGGARASSASDDASGLTVSVSGDQVTLKRSVSSTAGTGGTSAQVACTDDYSKLLKATALPAPTETWYAATLITWPAANAQSTATLSHALKNDPDLCVAQTSDSSTEVVVYFRDGVKADVEKLQQAGQASAALQAAARAAVALVKQNSFPAVGVLVQTLTKQGFYIKPTADLTGATVKGTMYVITVKTTRTKLVVALKGANGVIHTVAQGVKGNAKLGTAKP